MKKLVNKRIRIDVKVPIHGVSFPYVSLDASLNEKTGIISVTKKEIKLTKTIDENAHHLDNLVFDGGIVDDFIRGRCYELKINDAGQYCVDLDEYNKAWMNGQFYVDSRMPIDNFSFKFENGKEIRVDFVGGDGILLQEFIKDKFRKTIFKSDDRLFNGIPDMLEEMAKYLRNQL